MTSIARHVAAPGTGGGLFRNGAMSGTFYADFDSAYDPINGLAHANTAARYTVQQGDTLQSIAQAVWGDANFWYLLADANGLTASDELAAGRDRGRTRDPSRVKGLSR